MFIDTNIFYSDIWDPGMVERPFGNWRTVDKKDSEDDRNSPNYMHKPDTFCFLLD